MNKSESKYFNTAARMDRALISLLERKDFEYITVSEICKEAEVNRSTFYLHYENTTDLLAETTEYLHKEFLSYFQKDSCEHVNLRDCDLSELDFTSEKYLLPYLSYIKENRRVFLTVLTHSHTFGFEETYQQLNRHIFDVILERFRYPHGYREYIMRFYLNGITAIVTKWLEDGCKESIEQISQIIRKAIFGLNGEIKI